MNAGVITNLTEAAAIRILNKLEQFRKDFPGGKKDKHTLYHFVGMHRDVKNGEVSFLPWEFKCQINKYGYFLINFTDPSGYTESENTTTFTQQITIKYLVEVVIERFRKYTNAHTKEIVEYIEGRINNWISLAE